MSTRYAARAAVTAECDGAGRTRLTRLRSDGPLAVREAGGRDIATVYLVGAAAGPLGGDDLALHLTVAPGARLAVRSAATTLAMPGGGGAPGAPDESRFAITATVGAGGWLDFEPEPAVAVAGCRHRAVAGIELGPGAVLRWREELVLGRHAERPGRFTNRCDVTPRRCSAAQARASHRRRSRVRRPRGPGRRRAAGTVVLAGPDLIKEPYTADGLAVLPLAGHGVLVSATAENAPVLRRRLDQGEAIARTA